VQGQSRQRALRLQVGTVFGVAFLVGAVFVFATAFFLGAALQVGSVSLGWRQSIAAVGLVMLAAVDVVAMRQRRYSLIGLRRQTSKRLMYRYPPVTVAAAWGFDAGLAVTTFRVAALTWGALGLAFLGLSSWYIGLGYGLGFALPLTILLWTHRVGRAAVSSTPIDPGLESLLSRRPIVQLASATLLTAAGAVIALQQLL
jgi:hypothetical protein